MPVRKFVKRILPTAALSLVMVFTSGCGESFTLNLTADEQEAIVNYSADLLLKYDRNHQSALVDTYVQRELNARVDTIKALNAKKAEMEAKEKAENKGKDDAKDSSDDKDAAKTSPYAPQGEQELSAFLKQDGFDISYVGYEVTDSYPQDGSTDNIFEMDATPGKELMVFHFDIFNKTQEEKQCSILMEDVVFRFVINGGEVKNALSTLLMNDLATVDSTIAAGEKYDAVVVLEVPKGYESSVSDISLMSKRAGEQSIIRLQ